MDFYLKKQFTKAMSIMKDKSLIIKKPELLAPAGDLEKLKIAILYGADAVFIGGKEFSLRARASNFSIEEIKKISLKSKAEIEVFIHGGMCVSYSGRCTLSNNMTDRDANRGGCAHSCRWNYRLYNKEDELISAEDGHYNLSSKDLMAIPFIPQLIDAGVDSLKIEGRMKSIHYIATVVGTYRKMIDDYCADPLHFVLDEKYFEEISKAENRQTSIGALGGKPTENEQLYHVRTEKPTQEFIAIVHNYDELTKLATIEQRNYFTIGEDVEVYGPGFRKDYFTVEKIYTEDNQEIEVARHPRQILKVKVPFIVYPFDIIRKTRK